MEDRYQIFTQRLELTNPWTISRGTAGYKEYSYLKWEAGGHTAWGEAAHNSRYGESLESVRAGLERGMARILENPMDLPAAAGRIFADPGIPRSARAALDMALLDLEGSSVGFRPGPYWVSLRPCRR